MKITMTQALVPEGMSFLSANAPYIQIEIANAQHPELYPDHMQNPDAYIIRTGFCNKEAMDKSPNLKVIGRHGVGYETVDVEEATRRGIPVIITPGANSRSVAEHAIALTFAIARNLKEIQEEMAEGNWGIRNSGKTFELLGKKLGIIGMGATGSQLALLGKAIGMEVLGYTPSRSRERMERLGVTYCDTLPELLGEADIVSVHVPFTEDTRHLIGREQLALMKEGSVLLNLSRGGIVDDEALLEALDSGHLAGAGLDLFEEGEPATAANPLLHHRKVIATPHCAALTKEAGSAVSIRCAQGVLAVLGGKKWPYVADKKVYEHPRFAGWEWAQVQE